MAINEMIPLQAQVAPIGNALLSGYQAGSGIRQRIQEQPIRNQLLQQKATAGAQQQFNDEQQSLIIGAAELKPYVDAGDLEGARSTLMSRQAAAKKLGLNTRQTDEALQILDTQGIAALKRPIDALYGVGLRTGVLSSGLPQNAAVKIAPTQTGYDVVDPYTGQTVRSVTGVKPTIEQKADVDVGAYGRKRNIEAETAPLIAAGTERAKAGVELATAPEIEAAKATAKTKAASALTLPETMANADQTMQLVDQALNHPGLEAATGLSSKADPRNYLAGTDAYNFNVLMDQIQGKAFLQAFQSLKGGGAITEIEGKKAEQAIARLNRAQSKEEFVNSLNDLKTVIASGRQRAAQKAAPAQPAADDWTDL